LRARSARAVYHLLHCPAGPRARRQHRHSREALTTAKRSEALAKIGVFHIVSFRETPRPDALLEPLPGCRVGIAVILFAALHEVGFWHKASEAKASSLRQLLGAQRKCMDGRPRPPSTRMTPPDIGG
jgi:hypothetical protein